MQKPGLNMLVGARTKLEKNNLPHSLLQNIPTRRGLLLRFLLRSTCRPAELIGPSARAPPVVYQSSRRRHISHITTKLHHHHHRRQTQPTALRKRDQYPALIR